MVELVSTGRQSACRPAPPSSMRRRASASTSRPSATTRPSPPSAPAGCAASRSRAGPTWPPPAPRRWPTAWSCYTESEARRRRAAHGARPAALRPPPGLPDLRAGRRLPAAGVLLPLRRRAHELREGRHQAASSSTTTTTSSSATRTSASSAASACASAPRYRSPTPSTSPAAASTSTVTTLVRPPAGQGLLPLLRPVRRHVPHRRPGQQAAQGHAQLGAHQGAHHLPVLRRGLQLRPERRTTARSSASRPTTTPP